MILANQIRQFIVAPTLKAIGLWSAQAESLVLGTGAHESAGFQYLHQVNGPALSWFQIEPATYQDVLDNTLPGLPAALKSALRGMVPHQYAGWPPADYLMMSPAWAVAICRILYYRHPPAIPVDLPGQAAMWEKYYNTPLGAGTASEWLANYNRYCG